MRRFGLRLVSLGLLAQTALTGCGGALLEGEAQFKKGRYPEANQTLEALETDARLYGDAKRAEYALYRGLTLSALGDRPRASLWLREANAIEAAHPNSLSADDVRRLRVALESNDSE